MIITKNQHKVFFFKTKPSFLLSVFIFLCFSAQAQWFNDNMGSISSGTPSPLTWVNTTSACNPLGATNQGVLSTGNSGSPIWLGSGSNGAYGWQANSIGQSECTFTYTIALAANANATITSVNVTSQRNSGGANTFSSFKINGTSYTPSTTTVSTTSTIHTITISPALTLTGASTFTVTMTFSGANSTFSNWTNSIDDFKLNGNIFVAAALSTNSITGSPFCAGGSINVPFTASGTYNAGNVFTAQLSSSTGSFAVPTVIGTLTGTTSGTINATVPFDAIQGTAYRVRVISSNPAITAANNGANLTINERPIPSIVGLNSLYCDQSNAITLVGSPTGGSFTVNGNTTTQLNLAIALPTNTIVYTYTDANNCTNTASSVVNVANGSPLTVSQIGGTTDPITGLTSACTGTNISMVASSTGSTITNYQWLRNGLAISGAENPSFDVNSGWGDYQVQAINQDGCTSLSDTFPVSFRALPNAQAGNDRSLCSGATTLIGATTNSNYSYSWYPATGLSSTSVSQPTVTGILPTIAYILTVTHNLTGCIKRDTVNVNLLTAPPAPTISVSSPSNVVGSGSVVLCEGNVVTLTPTNTSGTALQWLKDNVAVSTTTNMTTPYSISNTNGNMAVFTAKNKNANGCYSPASNPISVKINPAAMPTISPIGTSNIIYLCFGSQTSATQLLTASVSAGNPTYTWLQSGVTASVGAGSTYLAEITDAKPNKAFQVSANYANGCVRTSQVKAVRKDLACRETAIETEHFSVYPNPAQHQINLMLNEIKAKAITISMFNSLGQLVLQKSFNIENETLNTTLDISHLGQGVYSLIVDGENNHQTTKIVKE